MKKWNRPSITNLTATQINSLVAANARSICRLFFVR